MRSLVYSIYTILFRLAHYLQKGLQIIDSRLWSVNLIVSGNNVLKINHSVVGKSEICITGDNNIVNINGHKLYKCEIKISGTNNIITISPQCEINNTIIVINGDNCNVSVSNNTRIGSSYMVCMGQSNHINIGPDCMIADNVDIWATDAHPICDENGSVINPSQPINIGKHVWLGKYSKVLKGVTIGENAIIGMSSVVTHDIPAGALVVGEQCRVVKNNVNWSREFIEV